MTSFLSPFASHFFFTLFSTSPVNATAPFYLFTVRVNSVLFFTLPHIYPTMSHLNTVRFLYSFFIFFFTDLSSPVESRSKGILVGGEDSVPGDYYIKLLSFHLLYPSLAFSFLCFFVIRLLVGHSNFSHFHICFWETCKNAVN